MDMSEEESISLWIEDELHGEGATHEALMSLFCAMDTCDLSAVESFVKDYPPRSAMLAIGELITAEPPTKSKQDTQIALLDAFMKRFSVSVHDHVGPDSFGMLWKALHGSVHVLKHLMQHPTTNPLAVHPRLSTLVHNVAYRRFCSAWYSHTLRASSGVPF